MSGYDNWKCTDPALENEREWELAVETYENSEEYDTDVAQWLKEMREENPGETFSEDDYKGSYAYDYVVEHIMEQDDY